MSGRETGTEVPVLYVRNLCALVAAGVAVSAWVLYYTEWFPVVGGLLGLGGVLAWVAFVAGLLKKTRKDALQALFEDRVLLSRRTTIACAVTITGVAALALVSGTIVLDAEAETVDRMVSISAAGEEGRLRTRTRLPARSVRRLLFFAPPWGTTLRVKASGLPGLDATLQPPFRTKLGVPAAFHARPLLLVRPDAIRSGTFARSPDDYEMRVTLDGVSGSLTPYGGQTVWIGTEADVPIPAGLLRRWLDDQTMSFLAEGSVPQPGVIDLVVARWQTPRAVLPTSAVEPGQQVTVEVIRLEGDHRMAATTDTVRPFRVGDPVQEVLLR